MNPSSQVSANSSDVPPDPGIEKRAETDRRKRPTSAWNALPPAGRRMRSRRAGEHRRPYFVDRFPAAMLAFILMLVIASIVDAILTVRLLQAGAEEANPVMNRLLDYGILPFFLGKYLLTVVGLPLLVVFKNHYLLGSGFRVGYLIPATVVLYSVLIGYQLVLIQRQVVS